MELMDDIFSVLNNSNLGIKGISQRTPARYSKSLWHEHALSTTRNQWKINRSVQICSSFPSMGLLKMLYFISLLCHLSPLPCHNGLGWCRCAASQCRPTASLNGTTWGLFVQMVEDVLAQTPAEICPQLLIVRGWRALHSCNKLPLHRAIFLYFRNFILPMPSQEVGCCSVHNSFRNIHVSIISMGLALKSRHG